MLKNLPKDLLDAAAGVLDESSKNRQEHYRSVVKKALEQFKVQSFSQLSETEQRIFSEWVVQRLDEEGHVHSESCGCGEEDDLLHKQAKVNAHSGLPELGEEDEKEDELAEEDEEDKEEVSEEDDKEDEGELAEEDEEEKKLDEEEDEDRIDGPPSAKKAAPVSEDYASPEPSSAIGQRLGSENPKHADVIKDSDVITGTNTYRLLIQFVNGRPEFVPPIVLPGSPSVEALGEIVAAFDDPEGVLSKAIADALDVPAERPEWRGNDLSESKKKIKKLLAEEVVTFNLPGTGKLSGKVSKKYTVNVRSGKESVVDVDLDSASAKKFGGNKVKEVPVANLNENTIDVEGLKDELQLMAVNNYPDEYRRKDVDGAIKKLLSDVRKMSSRELEDELSYIIPRLKQHLKREWK